MGERRADRRTGESMAMQQCQQRKCLQRIVLRCGRCSPAGSEPALLGYASTPRRLPKRGEGGEALLAEWEFDAGDVDRFEVEG